MKQNAISTAYLNMFLSFGFKRMVTQSTKKLFVASPAMTTCSPKVTIKLIGCLKGISHINSGFCMKPFFCRDKNRKKKEPLTICYFFKALKNEDYCYNFLFRPLHELQKLDYNEKNLDDLFDKFSTTLKNHLDMHLPETR